jgi:hypothetical protein
MNISWNASPQSSILIYNNSGTLRYRVRGDGTFNDVYPNSAWTSNWEHYVITYNGSKVYNYRNGVLQTASMNWSATVNNTIQTLSIGSAVNGLIDEVKIWNYARSAEQIGQDYIRNLHGNP